MNHLMAVMFVEQPLAKPVGLLISMITALDIGQN